MHSKPIRKAVSLALCALLVAPLASAQEIVRCESDRSRYQFCSVPTGNRVSLVRQISRTRCRLGDNWGFDRNGVWVDRGCSAEFSVGGNDRGRDRDDDKKIVAGAAVAAVAIAAAVAARRKERQAELERQERDEVAPWAVGTFRGYDDFERMDVEMTILPGGSVTGNAGGREFTGRLTGWKLEAGRHTFRIERSDNGFEARDEVNARHVVMFRRTGSGY